MFAALSAELLEEYNEGVDDDDDLESSGTGGGYDKSLVAEAELRFHAEVYYPTVVLPTQQQSTDPERIRAEEMVVRAVVITATNCPQPPSDGAKSQELVSLYGGALFRQVASGDARTKLSPQNQDDAHPVAALPPRSWLQNDSKVVTDSPGTIEIPFATEKNLLDNTDGVLRSEMGGKGVGSEHPIMVLSGWHPACYLLSMLTRAVLMTSLFVKGTVKIVALQASVDIVPVSAEEREEEGLLEGEGAGAGADAGDDTVSMSSQRSAHSTTSASRHTIKTRAMMVEPVDVAS